MIYEDEIRYRKLVVKAANRTISPSEEKELNHLGGKRIGELTESNRPLYEWDYPIKKKKNE